MKFTNWHFFFFYHNANIRVNVLIHILKFFKEVMSNLKGQCSYLVLRLKKERKKSQSINRLSKHRSDKSRTTNTIFKKILIWILVEDINHWNQFYGHTPWSRFFLIRILWMVLRLLRIRTSLTADKDCKQYSKDLSQK